MAVSKLALQTGEVRETARTQDACARAPSDALSEHEHALVELLGNGLHAGGGGAQWIRVRSSVNGSSSTRTLDTNAHASAIKADRIFNDV